MDCLVVWLWTSSVTWNNGLKTSDVRMNLSRSINFAASKCPTPLIFHYALGLMHRIQVCEELHSTAEGDHFSLEGPIRLKFVTIAKSQAAASYWWCWWKIAKYTFRSALLDSTLRSLAICPIALLNYLQRIWIWAFRERVLSMWIPWYYALFLISRSFLPRSVSVVALRQSVFAVADKTTTWL